MRQIILELSVLNSKKLLTFNKNEFFELKMKRTFQLILHKC